MSVDVDHRSAPDAGLVECPQCIAHAARAGNILRDLENSEMEIRRLRRRIRDLQAELDGVRAEDPRIGDALRVYEHWRRACRPKAKTFKGKRQEKVLARLKEGYSVDELNWAINGAAKHAWVKDGVRFDDLELICRDATKVDRFMELADADVNKRRPDARWSDLRAVIVEMIVEHHGPAAIVEDPDMRDSLLPCPACHDRLDEYRPLHINYDDEKPRVWCGNCNLSEDRLLFILDAKGTP